VNWIKQGVAVGGVPVIVGGDVFFGADELAAAPAPAKTPRPITRASVAPTPRAAPKSAPRFLTERDIFTPSFELSLNV